MNEELQVYIAELFQRIEEGIITATPEALRIAINIKRVEGIASIAGGLIALAIFYACYRTLMKVWPRFHKAANQHFNDEEETLLLLILIIVGFIAIASAIFAMVELLNVWNWIAVITPETAFSREVIRHFLK